MILSIITINRNNSVGLSKTIESVLSQTFVDFEYIVVDGASTDNSYDVINDKLSSKGESVVNGIQVKWISEPDNGVYNAMNKGIRMAIGDYLLFLNSGDYLVDKMVLEKVFSLNCSADILCGRCDVSENGKVVWTSNPPDFVTFGTLYNVGLAHQSTFIKRSLFQTLGLYREDFNYNSDIDFWYRSIILNGATTQGLNLVISDYNLDGISSKEYQTVEYKKEIQVILAQANFDRFRPDYDAWKDDRKNMEVLYWVRSKKLFYRIIIIIYKLISYLSRAKKKYS